MITGHNQYKKVLAKPIMIQGTSSSVGKSLICAALCRIFYQDGYRVAPFKAQNMSNNSFVTRDGLEMGRAQVVQAFAAGREPDVRMNPVLLKPSSDTGSQVVVKGKPAFHLNAHDWHETREHLRISVRECYESLASENEIVVIEGAGSPAEINLKKNDIVNMGMALMADAPVLLTGDIDRGGVFASLVGTIALLDPDEKKRVRGFIINKFRGDVALLEPGLRQLESITGVPVLGVVPWISHAIDEEDGVSDRFECKEYPQDEIDICIVRLPHISNFTDFIPLESIPGVTVRWCNRKEAIGKPDLLIIPGTKATIADLGGLRKSGIAESIIDYAHKGGLILGICGGFQMLGTVLLDPLHVESVCDSAGGLGLLDMTTTFCSEKRTQQTTILLHDTGSRLFGACNGMKLDGYEIHMGISSFGAGSVPLMSDVSDGSVTGVCDPDGRVAGTYLHGLFDSSAACARVINALRCRKGLRELDSAIIDRQIALNNDIDMLAATVRKSMNLEALYVLVNEHK